MDQTERLATLRGAELAELRKLVLPDGTPNIAELRRRAWDCSAIDDKSIFDEDAFRLASAFQAAGATHFFVARTCDLLLSSDSVPMFRFAAVKEEIEAFQGPAWFEINLDDSLLFCIPISCAVLRPGSVGMTTFMGSPVFVEMAPG